MSEQRHILDDSLGYAMGRASRALGTRLNRNFAVAGYNVTCEQWSILVNLWRNNGQSQGDLAGITCKDKTSITRLIDNMEKRDLVVRIPSKEDKRRKLIYLTKKGRDFQDRLSAIVQKTLQEAQKDIPQKKIDGCKDVLHQIYQNAIF